MTRLERDLTQGLMNGLRRFVDQVFFLSQVYVPVDRGTLKKSGTVRPVQGGFEIAYRTPYAAPVEFGYPEHWQHVRRHRVRQHRRRLGRYKRYSDVRQHQRGPFLRLMSERKGRFFLTQAFEETRPQMMRFVAQGFREALRK